MIHRIELPLPITITPIEISAPSGGAAALIASGVAASQALGVAVSVAALGVFSGAAIFLFAAASLTGRSLLRTRAAA
jgi:hypothetical protein